MFMKLYLWTHRHLYFRFHSIFIFIPTRVFFFSFSELREKVKSQETVNQRLKEAFKTKGHEFREAIFALLGYKVDGLPNSLYRLANLYAECPDQYLMFKVSTT